MVIDIWSNYDLVDQMVEDVTVLISSRNGWLVEAYLAGGWHYFSTTGQPISKEEFWNRL